MMKSPSGASRARHRRCTSQAELSTPSILTQDGNRTERCTPGIRTFITTPQLGISQGLQPVAGYSHGRAQPERVQRAMTLALRATVLYGVLALASVILSRSHS
jgi:hypothetical protein